MQDRKKLSESIAFKAFAFFLIIIMVIICLGSALAVFAAWEADVYEQSLEETKEETFGSLAYSETDDFLEFTLLYGEYFSRDGMHFAAYTSDGTFVAGYEGSEKDYYIYECYYGVVHTETEFHMESYGFGDYGEASTLFPIDKTDAPTVVDPELSSTESEETLYIVRCYVDRDIKEGSKFYTANIILDLVYSLRYRGVAVCILSFITGLAFFVFLMCSSGHRRGYEGIFLGPLTRLPFDIVTAVAALVIAMLLAFIFDLSYYSRLFVVNAAVTLLSVIAIASLFTAWCMDFAARIKTGKWWRNTIIYFILSFIGKIFRSIGRGLNSLIRDLPVIWKAAAYLGVIAIWGFLLAITYSGSYKGFIYVVGGTLIAVFTVWCATNFLRLREAAKKLAGGDLSAKVDTEHFFLDMKDHGDDLNSISEGMTKAVEERLKSERLKTELITNVSHDIKTPLTSIINYADLISKEPPGSEKITEYTDVLLRQGNRLKKLIQDLVDASKASTGNVEVNLMPCNAGVFLVQSTGEYDERLKASGLELILKKPEHPVFIMSDTRLLWRVLDNLMNNICKYAQENTRVYASLETVDDYAEICLKNISRFALDIDADELMERFVRGDSSRHTEGSGLGLSIARSLTELQGGRMELFVDGDLFKVCLRFKLMDNIPEF